MEFNNVQFLVGDETDRDECCVDSQAGMLEVFQKSADGCHPFLFVEDRDGDPVGLIAAEDVLQRVTNPSPNELTRWMDMPVEAALQSRIDVPRNATRQNEDAAYTRVAKDGKLLGVITENDVLISWRSIHRTLKNSQGDAVTGLPNRAAFDQHLAAECNRAQRARHSVAVILIDLDFFKQINDQFGHAAGDAALNAVATTLRSSLRSYDMVARFGGDEFAVICSGCRNGEIDIVVRRIREVILGLQTDPSMPRPMPTVSVGAAVAHDLNAISDPSTINQAADECLYAAKEAGRNCAWKCELGSDATVQPVFVQDQFSHVPQANGLSPGPRYQKDPS